MLRRLRDWAEMTPISHLPVNNQGPLKLNHRVSWTGLPTSLYLKMCLHLLSCFYTMQRRGGHTKTERHRRCQCNTHLWRVVQSSSIHRRCGTNNKHRRRPCLLLVPHRRFIFRRGTAWAHRIVTNCAPREGFHDISSQRIIFLKFVSI